MRLFTYLIISFFLVSCSFDNKSGIWKNVGEQAQTQNSIFKEFKTLSSTKSVFNRTIPIEKNFKFELFKTKKNVDWTDQYFSETNNYQNFEYGEKNKFIFKSKKISKNKLNHYFLYSSDNLIV